MDAKQVKVRDQGHVRSKALVLAYAVHESGRREVIGLDLGEVESEAFWTELLRDLRRRGLQGVRLCISDQDAVVVWKNVTAVVEAKYKSPNEHNPTTGISALSRPARAIRGAV